MPVVVTGCPEFTNVEDPHKHVEHCDFDTRQSSVVF